MHNKIVDVLLCSQHSNKYFCAHKRGQMKPHQTAFSNLVYMIECIMYLCVLNRMQWVLLCAQLASPMYFDIYTELAFENSSVHKTSALTSKWNRISRFNESNVSLYMILSLSQIIKIIGKHISLCNTFAFGRIKFSLGR